MDCISKRWSVHCRLAAGETSPVTDYQPPRETTTDTCSLPLVISNKEAANSDKSNTWRNIDSAVSYGPVGEDGDGPSSGLQETSFGSSMAQDEKNGIEDASYIQMVHDNPPIQHSPSDHAEQDQTDGNRKRYMSLKSAKEDNQYATPGEGFAQEECSEVCERERNERQRNTNGVKDSERNEDDHGYLVVFHSDKSTGLPQGAENEPPYEDESQYLIPVETGPKEERNRKEEKRTGTHSKGKEEASDVLKTENDRLSPTDNLDEDKYGCLSSQHASVNLGTFGNYAVSEFQDTQPGEMFKRSGISQSADEDGYGYLLVQHVENSAANVDKAGTKVPVNQAHAGGISKSGGQMDPDYEDGNNYDYIAVQEMKNWSGSPDNTASKLQENNATCPESSTEDNHDYLTVVHEREVDEKYAGRDNLHSTTEQERQNTTDQIYANVHDKNNDYSKMSAGARSELIYVNQEDVQNVGDDFPIYANSEVQQDPAMRNYNPAFDYEDENPIYDNEIMDV